MLNDLHDDVNALHDSRTCYLCQVSIHLIIRLSLKHTTMSWMFLEGYTIAITTEKVESGNDVDCRAEFHVNVLNFAL